MPNKPKKNYAARDQVREALAADAPKKYQVQIRDLVAHPILSPPKRPRGETNPLWLLLADAHFPFVDPATWAIAQMACRDLKPSGVIIMGDWVDFGSITTHEKSPEAANLMLLDELASGDDALDILDKAAPTAWFRAFLRGNHEWRMDRYLLGKTCPRELRSLIPSVEDGLHLKQRGYEYIVDKPNTLGTDHLFIHGHFFSKHHASRHLDALWGNVVYGHTHMPQQFTHSAPLGVPNRQVGVATGLPTMRNLLRDWHEEKRIHTWVNGFGVMEFSKDHSFVHNVYVVNGQAAYGRHAWDASALLTETSKPNARLQP